ncbi:hypothetical protein ACWDPV_13190 [Gordonia sp. NPDC003504]
MSVPVFTPLPGERVIHHAEFTPRLILRHLKVTVILTDQRVYMSEPHTLFAVIPHGGYTNSVPLNTISDVAAGNHTSSRGLFWGTCSILLGLLMLILPGIAGVGHGVGFVMFLLFGIAGVIMIVTAGSVGLRIRSFGGQSSAAPAAAVERPQLEALAHMILAQMLVDRSRTPGSPAPLSPTPISPAQSSPAAGPPVSAPTPAPPTPAAPTPAPLPPIPAPAVGPSATTMPPPPPAYPPAPAAPTASRPPQTNGWTTHRSERSPAGPATARPATGATPTHQRADPSATDFIARPGVASKDTPPGGPPPPGR